MRTSLISVVAGFGLIGASVAVPTAQGNDLITDELSDALAGTNIVRGGVEQREEEQCKINVRIISNWSESGMQRFRYAFQSDKKGYGDLGDKGSTGHCSDRDHQCDISIDIYNAIWNSGPGCASVRRNYQGVWWDENEKAYLADMSEVQGIAGYKIADCIRQAAEDDWAKSSGCTNKLTL